MVISLPAGKNVLIVYAHQSSGSFNAAAKDVAVKVLTEKGCTVDVSDLYEINFKATATVEDITGGVKDPDCFSYAEETKLAWEEDKLSSDIVKEQSKLKKADLVIFQDKKAILSFTTGSFESMFSPNAINGDMNVTLWPLQNGILHYCGFQVLGPQIFWAPAHVSRSDCSTMLDGWRARLQNLLNEQPIDFPLLEYFEKDTGFQLKPEIVELRATEELGISVGIHQGKKVPPNNQMRWHVKENRF
uniref:Ribosyldihydronicotinamide dehydrogenase [quinone]-like n=1 Tax=Gouania willdenowi TaxID=441366 RepID=A0A8C5N3Z9_GOUWI